ncbi:MAG: hypothetical protein K6G88_03050 [Lachnospiraceae bacterium]|nr:hypothetical protein [Lachnospiraceae bacterium]
MQTIKKIIPIFFAILGGLIILICITFFVSSFAAREKGKRYFKVMRDNYYIYSNQNNNKCILKHTSEKESDTNYIYNNITIYFIIDNEISKYGLTPLHAESTYLYLVDADPVGGIAHKEYGSILLSKMSRDYKSLHVNLSTGSWPLEEDTIVLNKANEFVVEMLLKNKLEFKYNVVSINFFSNDNNDYKVEVNDGNNVNIFDVIVKEQTGVAKIVIKDQETDILTGQIYLSGYDFILETGKNSLGIPKGEKLKFDTLEYE